MPTCLECKKGLYPTDPTKRVPWPGLIGWRSLCEGCGQYEPPIKQLEPTWVPNKWKRLQQLEVEVTGWRKKHAQAMTRLDKLNKLVEKKDSYLYG